MSAFDKTSSDDTASASNVDDSGVGALIDGAAKIAIGGDTASPAVADASDTAPVDPSVDSVSAAAIGAVDLTSDKPVKAKATANKSLAAHLSAGKLFCQPVGRATF